VGITLNPTKDSIPEAKFYMFPLSLANNTYIVTVGSNYTAPPEVDYSELGNVKIVSIDFIGESENTFCNVTFPNNLIWGELSVISKYYEMDEAYYSKLSNSTHTSIYFEFDQIALIKHFEIRATEGVSTSS
jgi:hypothetical protein